jgi:hypothetical protein
MSMRVILLTWCQIQPTSSGIRYVNCGPGHMQCIYSTAYSVFNIHLNVSALPLEISRQFTACYTANLVPNTAHILQFMLCELWSRPYTKYLQLRIFSLQYSAEGRLPRNLAKMAPWARKIVLPGVRDQPNQGKRHRVAQCTMLRRTGSLVDIDPSPGEAITARLLLDREPGKSARDMAASWLELGYLDPQ